MSNPGQLSALMYTLPVAVAAGAVLGACARAHVNGFAPVWVRCRFNRPDHPSGVLIPGLAGACLAAGALLVASTALESIAALATALAVVSLAVCTFSDAATRRVPLVLLQSFVVFSLLLLLTRGLDQAAASVCGTILLVCGFAGVGGIASWLADRPALHEADLWVAGGLSLVFGPLGAGQVLVHAAVVGLLTFTARGARSPWLWIVAGILGAIQAPAQAEGSAGLLAVARILALAWGLLVLRSTPQTVKRSRLAFIPLLAIGACIHVAAELLSRGLPFSR